MKMKKIQLTLGLFLMAGAIVSCGYDGKATVNRKEESELRALDLAWSDTANRKDLDVTVGYMADDGD